MEKKEFKKMCMDIYDTFDSFNDVDGGEPIYGKLMPLSHAFDYYEWLEAKPHLKDLEGKMHDEVSDVLYDVRSIFFALGYVIGQTFDLTYPDAQRDIDAIKQVIREKALLPYLPRKKKAT